MNKNRKIGIVGKPKKTLTVQEILKQMEREQRSEGTPTVKSSVTGDPYSLLFYVSKKANNGASFVYNIASERTENYIDKGKIRHYNSKALNGESAIVSGTAVAVLEKEEKEI
ncbi:MAG: hypothetical protein J6V40_02780 [Clostridia bacterium]|nr:hypothetical protein [Clostridia bacterium]